MPCFLVPYEWKQLEFSKASVNLYVLVVFQHWDQKHPRGQLRQTVGPIDDLDTFYEYQLYCKQLNHSLQYFTESCKNKLMLTNQRNSLRRNHPKNTKILRIELYGKYLQLTQ